MDKYERRVWVVALMIALIAGMTIGVTLANHYGDCQGTLR